MNRVYGQQLYPNSQLTSLFNGNKAIVVYYTSSLWCTCTLSGFICGINAGSICIKIHEWNFKGFVREQRSQAWSEDKELWCSYQNVHIYCCLLYRHSKRCRGSTHTPTYTHTNISYNFSCLVHYHGNQNQKFTAQQLDKFHWAGVHFYVHKISYNSQRT